jgi:hypothetical protein
MHVESILIKISIQANYGAILLFLNHGPGNCQQGWLKMFLKTDL